MILLFWASCLPWVSSCWEFLCPCFIVLWPFGICLSSVLTMFIQYFPSYAFWSSLRQHCCRRIFIEMFVNFIHHHLSHKMARNLMSWTHSRSSSSRGWFTRRNNNGMQMVLTVWVKHTNNSISRISAGLDKGICPLIGSQSNRIDLCVGFQ